MKLASLKHGRDGRHAGEHQQFLQGKLEQELDKGEHDSFRIGRREGRGQRVLWVPGEGTGLAAR